MLDKVLEDDVNFIQEKCRKDIGSVKYIATLVKFGSFNGKFRGHSEDEIYSEMKTILDQIYTTYPYEDNILMDNLHGRKKEDIEKSVILGLEEIKGNKNQLDGYFDTGEILFLTEMGKSVLNAYRSARGEPSIENYKRGLLANFYKRVRNRVLDYSD